MCGISTVWVERQPLRWTVSDLRVLKDLRISPD